MTNERANTKVPTIGRVAEIAGVSRSSVSRAFTNPTLLSPDTVTNILTIAKEIGYSPNQTARALSTGRSSNLALIVSDIANPFCPPLIRASQKEADRSDFCIFVGNSDEVSAQEDRLLERFSGRVEGVVLVSSRMPEDRIRFHAGRCPLVLVNRDIKDIPRVLIDSTQGITKAMHHLIALGHRRIVYVSGPGKSWSNQQRMAAAKRVGMAEKIKVLTVRGRTPTFDSGRDLAGPIRDTRATAVVAFDDLIAQGIMSGLAASGISVPVDISVVGCDDVLAAATYPALTTVTSRSAEAGRIATSILIEWLRGAAQGDTRYVLDTDLVVRDSTAVARSDGNALRVEGRAPVVPEGLN